MMTSLMLSRLTSSNKVSLPTVARTQVCTRAGAGGGSANAHKKIFGPPNPHKKMSGGSGRFGGVSGPIGPEIDIEF